MQRAASADASAVPDGAATAAPRIVEARDDAELRRAFTVMRELRPAYDEEAFLARARRQIAAGWRCVYALHEQRVRACAGFRFAENLAWGRHCDVDDLVTAEVDRGAGYGSLLFDWLVVEARRHACEAFHLDSGVQRFGAHRFYLARGMDITSHHFALRLVQH